MAPVAGPFPISNIAGRYLVFDVDAISHARREHNICGVLIGTIPNLSQQNVFLGIPLELMPEEARVLVEQGHAYIIDDVETHRKGFLEMNREDRVKFLRDMDRKGMELALGAKKAAEERSEKALKEKGLGHLLHEKSLRAGSPSTSATAPPTPKNSDAEPAVDDATLFDSAPASPAPSSVPEKKIEPQYITPTLSYPPVSPPFIQDALPLPRVPPSYPLFRFLHSRGYFFMPGLRFGCHYSVYPGDPLRFHSHFLATGLSWDQEFDLLDIVGGGRLGTGVKKAYLIGGEDESVTEGESVRAFSIEWAGL
ncbi:SEN34 subunit of tRNA-splicing endonuclease [Corynespora cassiicola Philippines]|uniref:tRNA-splicing endonuclease subunit Sen34 n=1 Tax=Corynespora cassiicola Philippines TaxID=1448308 RepID=A0A2T2N8X0_CORCC|nr:SEN34 subunit of tRNA-splicing endonuclease [Corynespora cassiicola Philippines]